MPFLLAARDAAEAAARRAADLIRARAGAPGEVEEKGVHDLVTDVDRAAEAVIVEHLRAAFPEVGVLAEEGGSDGGDGPRWIIDPIDGTTNFTHGVPPYAVSIALEAGGQVVVGVVLDVSRDECFRAVRGGGLEVDGRPAGVSRTRALGEALVATGFPYRSFGHVDAYLEVLKGFMLETRGVRRHGSAAIDLAYVACGRFDAFWETGLAPWDVAAGSLLVAEGGGRATAFDDEASPVYAGTIAATNGRLHADVMERVQGLRNASR